MHGSDAAFVDQELPYVSWESFAKFSNQRQALEIGLAVAACLGEGTRFAVHDWRRSVYSTTLASAGDTSGETNTTSPTRRRATSMGGAKRSRAAALLSLRSDNTLPFELLANMTHLAETAAAHGGVLAVPWRQVPPRARILRLRMSASCHYSCAWIRREVVRQCPRGASCTLGAAAPTLAADGRVARAATAGGSGAGAMSERRQPLRDVADEDVARAGALYSSVVRPGEGGAFDFYEDDTATAHPVHGAVLTGAGAAGDETSRTAYYVESSEHVVEDASVELSPEAHADAAHLAEHGDAAPEVERAPAAQLGRRERHPVVVVPLLDWGAVEAIFAAGTVHPHNVLRPGERIVALARLLQRHLVAPVSGATQRARSPAQAQQDEGYSAAHISIGERPSYALYNCRLASRIGVVAANDGADILAEGAEDDAPGADVISGTDGGQSAGFTRVFTPDGVACQRRGTTGKRGAADYLTVTDVLRAHAFAPERGARRLYVATNAPAAPEIASLRIEAARSGVSLFTLADLVRRAGPEAASALEALERDAGDEEAVRLMLDQQLCADARAYVATSVSSWDQYVLRERAARATKWHATSAKAATASKSGAQPNWHAAAALADYALYVQHERARLATYGCANEARPGSTLVMVAFMLVSCVAMSFVRGSFSRLRELAAEARRRVVTAQHVVFASSTSNLGAFSGAGVVRVRPLRTRDAALAITLSLAAFLVCVHGALLFLLEPLATTAHLTGARTGPGPSSGPNVVAVLSHMRALALCALCSLLVLDVGVRALRVRLAVVACALATGGALYACSHLGLSAADFALARAPLPTLATLLACALVGAAVTALCAGIAARRLAKASHTHTSIETSVQPPVVRPRAVAVLAGSTVLALSLRVCYVTEAWRIDDLLDLARTVLEVVAVAHAGAVLARPREVYADSGDVDNYDEGEDDGTALHARGSVLVNLDALEGDRGATARFDSERRARDEAEALEREIARNEAGHRLRLETRQSGGAVSAGSVNVGTTSRGR